MIIVILSDLAIRPNSSPFSALQPGWSIKLFFYLFLCTLSFRYLSTYNSSPLIFCQIVACENILRGMWKSKNAHHFRDPVDLKKVKFLTAYVSKVF